MICGRTPKDDIENERKLSKHYFPKKQSISQELILYHLPHLLYVEHSILIHDQYPTCGMFFSQLGPVHPIFPATSRKLTQTFRLIIRTENSPAQNHFPTISQPFPNHGITPNRIRSTCFPISQALLVPPRFLGKLLPVLPEEKELARVARRGFNHETVENYGLSH